MTSGLDDVRL